MLIILLKHIHVSLVLILLHLSCFRRNIAIVAELIISCLTKLDRKLCTNVQLEMYIILMFPLSFYLGRRVQIVSEQCFLNRQPLLLLICQGV